MFLFVRASGGDRTFFESGLQVACNFSDLLFNGVKLSQKDIETKSGES